jgi:hypothetical protein
MTSPRRMSTSHPRHGRTAHARSAPVRTGARLPRTSPPEPCGACSSDAGPTSGACRAP